MDSFDNDFKVFRTLVEVSYAQLWGPRCEEKDIDEFPELSGNVDARCACCYAYELLDKHLDNLELETTQWFNKER